MKFLPEATFRLLTVIICYTLSPLMPCCSGRPEFMKFLPEGTQGVAVQPIGSAGVLIAATDTIRGISRLDQVRGVRGHGAARGQEVGRQGMGGMGDRPLGQREC